MPQIYNIRKLQEDFSSYYAPNMLKVRNEEGKIVPYTLRPEQLFIEKVLAKGIKKHRVFVFALKSRQVGISTWAEARVFHRTHMFKNAQAVIMAHDAKASDNIFSMTKRYYDFLPDGYRPMIHHSNKKELTFENPSKEGRIYTPGMKSKITVFTAGTKESARSFTADAGHLSEFAFYPDGANIVSAVEAGIPELPGKFCIFETTGNGVANFAYDLWHEWVKMYNKKGEDSQYIPFFVGWHQTAKYRKPFITVESKRDFEHSLQEEEKTLKNRFNLTSEQLNWRRDKLVAYGGDKIRFMVEYPIEPEESFLVGGRPIFDIFKLQSARGQVKPILFEGEITHSCELYPANNGRFKIWEFPKPEKDYILGVDTKGDSDKGDECVIEILDSESLEQVAEWVGDLEPVSFAPFCKAVGTFYGTARNNQAATLVIERNGSGLSVIYELNKDYYNLYRLEKFDGQTVKLTDKIGWDTNVRTKPMIMDFATFCFHNNYCHISSLNLLDEMRKFIATSNSGAAEGTFADNRVMAWMIALFIAGKEHQTFSIHSPVPYNKIEAPDAIGPLEKMLGKWRAAEIDVDELDPIFHQYEDLTSWHYL